MIERAILDRAAVVMMPAPRLRMYEVEIGFEDVSQTKLRLTVSGESLFQAGAAAMSLVLQIGEVKALQFRAGDARVMAVREL